jgi:hypothetical protein
MYTTSVCLIYDSRLEKAEAWKQQAMLLLEIWPNVRTLRWKKFRKHIQDECTPLQKHAVAEV